MLIKVNRYAVMFFIAMSCIVVPVISASAAQILGMRGVVQIKELGNQWVNASTGTTFQKKSFIKTGGQSVAIVKFSDGSKVKIGSSSVVFLYNMSSQAKGVYVRRGSVIASVKKLSRNSSFRVNTPNSVVGVRGTQFYVMVQQHGQHFKSVVCVKEGEVAVNQKGSEKKVSVKSGFGTWIHHTKEPTEPKPVKNLVERVNWEMDSDKDVWKGGNPKWK